VSIFLHNSPFVGSTAPRVGASRGRVIIATIERAQGDTGIHAHTDAMMSGLHRAGVECELANPFSAGPKWLPIFAMRKLILNPVNKTWSLRWYRHWHYAALRESLTRALLRRNADAVIAQCPVSARAALEVRRKLRLSFQIAMVCHFNYSEATEYRDKGELKDKKTFERMMKLESFVLRSVNEVIYVSGWAKRVVETDRGIQPQSSRVIWNGIATDVDTPTVQREEIGLNHDDRVLINVGTLEPRKNQIGLLDLFQVFHQKNPRAKLLLVGDGPQRGEIEQKIRRSGLSDAVVMVGHRTDVPVLLKISDMYVHYSKLENCPVVLLEAARAKLPIAAIPVGGVEEIGEKLGGIVRLNENDTQESARMIETLLNDPQSRQAHGSQMHAGFEQHFTRDAMVQEYLDALGLAPAEVAR
jgi:glycosyltransferase involved in cell wall biosynthesis